MALTEKQGLEQALADVNDTIALIIRQIRTVENSTVTTAAEKVTRLADLRAELAVFQATQSRLITALNQLNLNNQRNTASSADTVAQGQVARSEDANPGAPAPPTPKKIAADGRIEGRGTTSESNATRPVTTDTGGGDFGTDAETRTLTNTQSISSPLPKGPLPAARTRGGRTDAQNQEPVVNATNNATSGGIGASGEDGAKKPGSQLQNALDNLYGTNNIVAQENILDQYPSYTYSLSWYLLDPDTYKTLYTQSSRSLQGYYLLAQSGGANVQNKVPTYQGESNQAGRNPSFPLDYYIDDFYVDYNYPATPGSRGSSVVTDIGFSVTEPNGITLLRNLYAAIRNLYVTKGIVKPDATINYSAAHFCMVVRFYGYDANGNLVMPIGPRNGVSDKSSIVEKYIPFNIINIDFAVSNKLVEYKIKCASPGQNHNASTNRGTIPTNFTFNGATVQEILTGGINQQTVTVADNSRPLTDTVFGRG
jgi:hypothetical protein